MATLALTDCKLVVGVSDLSAFSSSVALTVTGEPLDVTTFGQAYRVRIGGLKSVSGSGVAFYDTTSQAAPKRFFSDLGSTGATEIVTICPTDGTNGEDAYGLQSIAVSYGEGGTVGGRFEQPLAFQGRGVVYRGSVLSDVDTARTSTFSTTGVQLGAVAAGETLYAAMHVPTASAGDTLDVVVESDNDSGFGSATTRITFTQVGASADAQWGSVAGAVTDDWWRITGTIAGVSPSYNVLVTAGII